jgi:ATP-binding cassette, subfamily D (ALD), peroxisomal long-chain fatty acid import protein
MSFNTAFDKFSQLPRSQRRAVILAAFSALVLRSRLLQLPQEIIAVIINVGSTNRRVSKEEVDQAVQQLYEKRIDGSKVLLVPHGQGISRVSVTSSSLILILITSSYRSLSLQFPPPS